MTSKISQQAVEECVAQLREAGRVSFEELIAILKKHGMTANDDTATLRVLQIHPDDIPREGPFDPEKAKERWKDYRHTVPDGGGRIQPPILPAALTSDGRNAVVFC